jgi:hypothetical protein
MGALNDAIRFIVEVKAARAGADKEEIQGEFVRRFSPTRSRSLLLGRGYALRFSEVRGSSFPNTVLSLSALRGVDDRPMVVCAVGPTTVRFLLANATFLRKVSHSSHQLRTDNVKGSFNGSDILTDYGGLSNRPENFERLFAMHSAFTWTEHVERLVEATHAIVGRDNRFHPTDAQRQTILSAPERAWAALESAHFTELDNQFRATVVTRLEEIIRAAAVENVNLRGNRIEQIVTGGVNAHELGDLRRDLAFGKLVIDVKTKLADRMSAPKAYNIDKMLAFHAEPGSVFAFLLLNVDVHARAVVVRLVPVLDDVLLEATVVQHHWAGRVSRGVTQLAGRYDRVLAPGFKPSVDLTRAKAFLLRLLGE